jgi:pyridoxine/pyridoxamine 5'-phosphate oxidase
MDQDLASTARAIIDASLYMALGTADEDGRPWVSPVFFATAGYREFFWISSPEVTHSRNIAARPEVSVVVFDSRVPAGTGQGVYMSATAEALSGEELERGLAVYPGSTERGGWTMTPEQVQPPATYRLYRATVSEHSMLCPRPAGEPCAQHGRAFDHRTEVAL